MEYKIPKFKPILPAALLLLSATGLSFSVNAADLDIQAGLDCAGNYGALNCTANDVSIADITPDPAVTECIEGENFDVALTATIRLNSHSTRRDVGLWIAETNGDPTLPKSDPNGAASCLVATFNNDGSVNGFGSAPDEDPYDLCGDALVQGTVVDVDMGTVTVPCIPNENDQLVINPVVTWVIDKNAVCNGPDTARPGSQPSKCEATPHILDITVIRPPAKLTLEKTVINDNGGSAADTDWTLQAAGPVTISGVEGDLAITGAEVPAGTYTLSESGPGGYAPSGWVCTGGTLVGNQLTVVSKDDVTCTITNDDAPAGLTIIKIITSDDGGTATLDDFNVKVDGTEVAWDNPASMSYGSKLVTTSIGTYTLSEDNLAGYTEGTWSCTDAQGPVDVTNGGAYSGADVTVVAEQNVTCAITNTDDTANLTLIKDVINDNGGTAVKTDWTLYADTTTFVTGVGQDVNAGTYTLSESAGPAGYSPSAWSCVGGSLSGAKITLALGESAVCTITNDDNAANLTLIKDVINDNGGTAVKTDWTLYAAGPTPLSGAGGVAATPVNAGTYTLSESAGPAGYTAGAWSCTGGTLTGNSLALALGQNAVCTIENDDDGAELALVKTVTNDNGGTAVKTDWTLYAAGPTPISGAGGVAATPVDAGTYALSESAGPAGYTAGAWSCTAGTLVGNTLTLANAVSATCTINNDDNVPVVPAKDVPTLMEWALILLSALLAFFAIPALRRS